MADITQIPSAKVPVIYSGDVVMTTEWYRYFYNLYGFTGGGTGAVPTNKGGTGQTEYTDGQLLIGNSTTKSLDKATITGGAGINVTNGPGSIALSLGGSGVTPGIYGNASTVPQLTINEYGIISLAANVSIGISATQIVSGIIDPARISGAYPGITGVGTITSGVWQGTLISVPYGGTGLASYALGDMLYATGTTALSKLAIGASTYILASTGTAPQWVAPSTISIGTATNLAGGSANQIAYQTGAGATSFITAPTIAGTYLNWSGSAFQWSANPLGDVVGPASATDTAIALFDGTTGKLIQNSSATINNLGQLTLGTGAPVLTSLLTLRADAGASFVPAISLDGYGSTTYNLGFRRAGGTIASPTATLATSVISILGATTGDGTTYANTSAIQSLLETLATPTSMPTAFTFATTAVGAIARREVIRVNSNGDLKFSITGQRISGDMTTTTFTDRLSFQTSTANGATSISALPNGTGVASNINCYNNADPTNAALLLAGANSTEAVIQSTIRGTGTYLPIVVYTNGTEKLRIAADATGTYTFGGTAPRFVADFTTATASNRAMFQTSTANSVTSVDILPNGTGTAGYIGFNNSSDADNSSFSYIGAESTQLIFNANKRGTGSYLPMVFFTGGSERLRITTNGGAAFGGSTNYGTSGQVLTSAGDAPPIWTTPTTGTVTSVSGTGTVNGITLTGTVTSSGSLTLGGTLSGIGNSQLTNSTISGVALGGSLFNLTAGTGISFSSGTTYNGSAAITINATSTGTVTSVAALTLGTTGTDLSSTVANGTTTPVITLNVPTASATNRGALSSTDWSTFNNKQAALVSGTNIKTVGGVSLLGSGDVGTIGTAYGGTGLNTFTANRIFYASSTSVIAQSAGLTFDGTNFATTGNATAASFIPSSSTVPTNGMYLSSANTLSWATNSTFRMSLDSAGTLSTTGGISSNTTVTATTSLKANLALGSGAGIDTSGQTGINLSASSNALLISGAAYYLVAIAEVAVTGQNAVYVLGNGNVSLLGGTGSWVASTSTPGASQLSIAYVGGNYRLYNGYTGAGTYTFKATVIKMS